MDELFSIYSPVAAPGHRLGREPSSRARRDEPPAAHARAIKAKALDLLRGLLPAASLSHMGIYASGQTYEQLILHLLAHPLPEARRYGAMILDAVKAVIPSFVTRVERPDRGGEWIGYLERRAADGRALGASAWDCARADEDVEQPGPSVRLTSVQGDEDDLLAALLFESATASEAEIRRAAGAAGRRSSGPAWSRTWSASGPTAATGRAGALRRSATGLRSWPTTAPSATCSATGCSPSSGRR